MNKLALTAAIAATISVGIPAFASDMEQITRVDVETIKSEPVMQRNILVAPELAASCTKTTTTKCDQTLVPTNQPTVFIINAPTALTSLPGVMIEVVRPDDLVQRGGELTARILVEKSAGTITAAQADDLLSRLNQVFSIESNMKANGTLSWKQVEHTYRAFDRISHDLDQESTDTNRALASSFIVL